MSNRHLVLTAAVVWAVAVFVGVFVAAPLWFGLNVDAGLYINALAAFGSVAAASAAVWIATTDRRERKQERDAEDAAQAKLVTVLGARPDNPLQLQVWVKNYGTRAIIDITFIRLEVEGHDHLDDLQPNVGPLPVIAQPGGSSIFTFAPETYQKTDPYWLAIRGGPHGEPQTITVKTRLTATVRWTDAQGKIWQRTGSGPGDQVNTKLSPPVRIA
jgi:hypothetical protein